jgi:DeoR/GlpR family transcriptional regulator of sugar metabolism
MRKSLPNLSRIAYSKTMLNSEREEKILSILGEKNACTVYELSEKLYVSESTIRRDLTSMEHRGLVTRTFGGVILKSGPSIEDTSFFLREKENLQEKRALVKEASAYIQSNSAIFIDSSTTCLQIVSLLNDFKNLLIITNGIMIANEIVAKTKHKVILLGGEIQPSTNSVLGTRAEEMLKCYHANLAILSTYNADPLFGFSEQTENQSFLKKIMIANAEKSIMLVAAEKVGKKALSKTCDVSDIDIVISEQELAPIYHEKAPETTFIVLDKIPNKDTF